METYYALYFAALLLPMIASLYIHVTYNKYKGIRNFIGKTGFEVAREMLDRHGLGHVYVIESPGELTDAYDSSRKTVRLSTEVFHGTSVAALAVAAHECGHAIQDKENYSWMTIRSFLFPIVSIGTKIAYVILIISIFLSSLDFAMVAFIMILLSLVFEVVTLPVEFDASKRAKEYLRSNGIIDGMEANGVDAMLNSAAFTYVAAVLSSLLELLRILMILNNRRD